MILLPAAAHTLQRWKNGGGSTIEIAVHPPDAGLADFDWRVSMATMSQDGPFSAFPGIARTLAILDGPGVALTGESFGETLLRRHSAPFVFSGAEAVSCRLLGGETTDLNLMSRTGSYRHAMRRLAVTGTVRLKPVRATRLMLLVSGTMTVSDGTDRLALTPHDALRDDGGTPLELTAPEPALGYLLTIAPL